MQEKRTGPWLDSPALRWEQRLLCSYYSRGAQCPQRSQKGKRRGKATPVSPPHSMHWSAERDWCTGRAGMGVAASAPCAGGVQGGILPPGTSPGAVQGLTTPMDGL